ncbi:transcription termination/antitermination protein NusG [Blattabacterium cuenoti]
MEDLKKKWYVIKTMSGQENKVKSYIENEIRDNGFQNSIGKILVPIEKIVQMRKGKKIYRDKVHYPGYVMIEANLEGETYHKIKNVSGVITVLSEGKGNTAHPTPMRKEEVNRMLGKMDQLYEKVDPLHLPFVVGETIKVIDGPFSGFNGTIEKIHEEKRKIELAVLIFGRKTPLELNFTQIEKI